MDGLISWMVKLDGSVLTLWLLGRFGRTGHASLTSHSIRLAPSVDQPVSLDGRVICRAEAVRASARARTEYLATMLRVWCFGWMLVMVDYKVGFQKR